MVSSTTAMYGVPCHYILMDVGPFTMMKSNTEQRVRSVTLGYINIQLHCGP